MSLSTVRRFTVSSRLLNVYYNPHKAKKLWPPDFTKLSPKRQFILERRYKRRAQLKWARPRWNMAVKLAQYGSLIFVLTYGVFFMDSGREDNPFNGFRSWVNSKLGSIWSSPAQPDDASPISSLSKEKS